MARIRILKSIVTVHGVFQPGDVTDVEWSMARDWCRAGIAMEDKAEEPKEVKVNGKKAKRKAKRNKK